MSHSSPLREPKWTIGAPRGRLIGPTSVRPCSATRPVRCDDGVSSGALVVGNGFGYRVSADGGDGRVAVSVEVRGAEA